MAGSNPIQRYVVGERPTITARFTTALNVLTDPTTITFITVDPAGTQVTTASPNAAISSSTTGIWVYTFPGTTGIATVGTWAYRVKGVGTIISAEEGTWEVLPSLVITP